MEVVAKSKAHVVLDACFQESGQFFTDHERLMRCNPFCSNVRYLPSYDIFQWIFQVDDPRNNPFMAIFFVRQQEHPFSLDDEYGKNFVEKRIKNRERYNGNGKRIYWEPVQEPPADVVLPKPAENGRSFVGTASSDICLLHHHDNKTSVYFDTNITMDFDISFPLNLMPEGVLRFMTEAVMSQVMQQATEAMLCKVQADMGCASSGLLPTE